MDKFINYSIEKPVSSTEKASLCPQPVNCTAEVVNPRTLGECENYPRRPYGRNGFLVAKIPVVLSEFIVQIVVEAGIRLQERALDIKRIKKDVVITQCELLPHTDKLFLAGYIRKNIEYSTVGCADSRGISGDIRHTTHRIPFECVTQAPFCPNNRPQVYSRYPQTEVEFLNKKENGKDNNEQNFKDFIPFNEKVKCELVWAKINEKDIQNDEYEVTNNSQEHTFQNLTEKIVLHLKLKLVQVQQVNIYGPNGCDATADEKYVKYEPDEDIEG